jgi:hypothetical protein
MKHRRAFGLIAGCVYIAVASTLWTSAPAAAECTGSIYFRPFREAVLSADAVVIGEVTRNYNENLGQPGLTSHFRVTADETVRGEPRDHVDIDRLPALRGGCGAVLVVRVGWKIALAIDARRGLPDKVTGVAYLNHQPDRYKEIGIPLLTAAEVRALASLPATDSSTSSSSDAVGSGTPGLLVLGFLSAFAVALAWDQRRRQRRVQSTSS